MNIDPLEEILEDPDKRAKLMVLITGVQILIPILIAIGFIMYILFKLGVI